MQVAQRRAASSVTAIVDNLKWQPSAALAISKFQTGNVVCSVPFPAGWLGCRRVRWKAPLPSMRGELQATLFCRLTLYRRPGNRVTVAGSACACRRILSAGAGLHRAAASVPSCVRAGSCANGGGEARAGTPPRAPRAPAPSRSAGARAHQNSAAAAPPRLVFYSLGTMALPGGALKATPLIRTAGEHDRDRHGRLGWRR